MAHSSLTGGLPPQPSGPQGASTAAARPEPSERPAKAMRPQPAASITWADVEVQVFGDLAGIEAEWKAFERKADCTVFQTFGWLAKWQQHIGECTGTSPAIVFGRDAGGDLVFIMQLAIERRGPIRRLTWLGSELCDYNAPLLAEDFSQRVEPQRFTGALERDRRAAAWPDRVRAST